MVTLRVGTSGSQPDHITSAALEQKPLPAWSGVLGSFKTAGVATDEVVQALTELLVAAIEHLVRNDASLRESAGRGKSVHLYSPARALRGASAEVAMSCSALSDRVAATPLRRTWEPVSPKSAFQRLRRTKLESVRWAWQTW